MRPVVLDARPLSHPQPGGYRSYVRALVQGLAELPSLEFEILLYLDRPVEFPLPFATRTLSRQRLLTDFVLFRQQAQRDRAELVHGSVNYLPPGLPCKTVLPLFDALLLQPQPGCAPRQRLLNAYWALQLRHSAQTVTRHFTVSHAAAHALAKALGGSHERFSVIPLGLALPCPSEVTTHRTDNTVLALVSADPRKNLGLLYAALPCLRDLNPTLRLVCPSPALADGARRQFAQHGLAHVEFLIGLSDAQLATAYAQASVFVFPSRWEGFGLPPLEAMQAGTPVVASDAPALLEVLGDAALFVHPDRPQELAHALRRLLTEPTTWELYQARGREQAARYTTRRMAEATVALWREVLA